jgi:hypothetical protein
MTGVFLSLEISLSDLVLKSLMSNILPSDFESGRVRRASSVPRFPVSSATAVSSDYSNHATVSPGRTESLAMRAVSVMGRTSFFSDAQPRDYVNIPVVTPQSLVLPRYEKDYRSLMDNPWKMTIVPGCETVYGQQKFNLVQLYSPVSGLSCSLLLVCR